MTDAIILLPFLIAIIASAAGVNFTDKKFRNYK